MRFALQSSNACLLPSISATYTHIVSSSTNQILTSSHESTAESSVGVTLAVVTSMDGFVSSLAVAVPESLSEAVVGLGAANRDSTREEHL